ncbi:hypothetical protein [Pseudomonas putida]|uniref:Uncharacterized protein n=1 Tax=Pseudomonas putida TaxID=303 RepID=A0A7V8J258_PSEPU|nr:hypothetical protein [Pseudomonas putida]KAF0252016.1 hypothetical protein GN299_25595 [Pseudomonas putida]
MSINYATQTTAETGYVTNQEAGSLLALYQKHFEMPTVLAEKTNAKTFVPATFRIPTRNDNNVVSSGLIIFDIDQKLGEGYDDDMIALEEAEDALLDMNLEHFIYTSHSHTLQAPRFRIVIAVSRPYLPSEHNTICAAMLESLDEFLDGRLLRAIDRCWRTPSQCYYVYTTHPDRHSHAISFYNPGKPADVDELKLHQSQYGMESQYKPGAARQATGNTGARGRSYDLNRIVGGMITSSTEAEIAARLFDYDNTAHAGDEYFRDMQYPRNRPKPGESGDAAAWRSCQIFAKSHINSIKRKFRKQIDTTIVVKKASSREPMPTHDAMVKFKSFNSKPTERGGETVLLELQVMSGEHAGRHFWHRLYGNGNHEVAIKISNSIIQKISRATQTPMESLKDIIKAEGKTVKARIKLKPGTGGYKPQNEIGDIHLF